MDPEDTKQAMRQFKKACRSATLNGMRGPGGGALRFLHAGAEDLTTAVVQNSPFGGCNALGHQVLKLVARTPYVSFQSNELWQYVAMTFISVASTPPICKIGETKCGHCLYHHLRPGEIIFLERDATITLPAVSAGMQWPTVVPLTFEEVVPCVSVPYVKAVSSIPVPFDTTGKNTIHHATARESLGSSTKNGMISVWDIHQSRVIKVQLQGEWYLA